MKTIQNLLLLLAFPSLIVSCNAQSEKKVNTTPIVKAEQVEMYYFHYSRRCATCQAVESVSKEAINDLYGGKVNFSEYNLDEPEGEEKGKELEISGQTLLIVAGGSKIDITNEGFLNARSNPEKLKQIIKEKIDPLL